MIKNLTSKRLKTVTIFLVISLFTALIGLVLPGNLSNATVIPIGWIIMRFLIGVLYLSTEETLVKVLAGLLGLVAFVVEIVYLFIHLFLCDLRHCNVQSEIALIFVLIAGLSFLYVLLWPAIRRNK